MHSMSLLEQGTIFLQGNCPSLDQHAGCVTAVSPPPQRAHAGIPWQACAAGTTHAVQKVCLNSRADRGLTAAGEFPVAVGLVVAGLVLVPPGDAPLPRGEPAGPYKIAEHRARPYWQMSIDLISALWQEGFPSERRAVELLTTGQQQILQCKGLSMRRLCCGSHVT